MPLTTSLVRPDAALSARRRSASQNELAYAKLRDSLITLVYKPGEFLNTAELMARFGIGRTPINQALHRLSSEGLIRIVPRKGVVVAPLSIDEALDIVEVRLVNEALCMRLAALNASPEGIDALMQLKARCADAARQHDIVALMNADLALHRRMAELSGNRILMDLLDVLHARSLRFWAITLSSPGHLAEIDDEHGALIDAIAQHDPEGAARAVQTHILSFKASLFPQREEAAAPQVADAV